ncbi:MAG: vitamin K epoxide reductase family protein [Leucobacter sp.]
MSDASATTSRPLAFAIFTVVAGVVGWFASFELLTEYVKTLQDPSYVPNCAVSVLVTCGPNMGSWQGSLLGFSNTIIGVSAFMAPIIVGVALLAGARFPVWFWTVYRIGLGLGFIFILWLAQQSIFVLGTLCPWCMVVWTVMIPLFWVSLWTPGKNWSAATLKPGGVGERLHSWAWVAIVITYLLIAFLAQLQLDWIAEFSRA